MLNNKFDEDGIKYYDELTREYILNALAELQEEREWSVASVNRYSAILTRVSNILYKDLELIDKPLKLPKKSEKNERLVWLTKTEARRFIDNVYDSHQQQVRFAFATGLRRGNVYGLEWKWVDMSQRLIRIPAENMKAGKALNVPLNDDAVKIIKEQIGEHDQFVFGVIKPAKSTLWKKWVIKADIRSDFTFHCIRHSWASWLVQSGLPLHVLQELGGWADYKMVLRYAHLAPSQLHDAAKTSELGQVEKVKLKEVK